MSCVAIIPARGGSKRIPRKNIKDFMGKPMIAYAIEAALTSGVFDEVMVSTDDMEIAEIARKYGAKVPFMRSERTSNDHAVTFDVLEEVIENYQKNGVTFDACTCIYPCVPFLSGDILADAYKIYQETQASTVMSVLRFECPVQRAFRVNEEGFLAWREPQYALTRTQDLEASYHDAGMFYIINVHDMLTERLVICKNAAPIEIPRKVAQDIDTLADWEESELKYKILFDK